MKRVSVVFSLLLKIVCVLMLAILSYAKLILLGLVKTTLEYVAFFDSVLAHNWEARVLKARTVLNNIGVYYQLKFYFHWLNDKVKDL